MLEKNLRNRIVLMFPLENKKQRKDFLKMMENYHSEIEVPYIKMENKK